VNAPAHYSIQAVLVYVALGVALGLIGWAVLIHDGGGNDGPAVHAPAKSLPIKGQR
jgi:hypothetical protein